MCSVDRRRYWDGGFNGHWTSQLAPFQCSGTLFSLALLPPDTLVAFFFSFERTRLSFSYQSTDSRSICDLEGFRAEAGHYGPLFYLRRNTENRGPILSGKKFIARSTLIGREIIGHSFPLSARSKRRSLIHDFSRIIAGPCHPSFPFLPSLSLSLFPTPPFRLATVSQFRCYSFPWLVSASRRGNNVSRGTSRFDDFLRATRYREPKVFVIEPDSSSLRRIRRTIDRYEHLVVSVGSINLSLNRECWGRVSKEKLEIHGLYQGYFSSFMKGGCNARGEGFGWRA